MSQVKQTEQAAYTNTKLIRDVLTLIKPYRFKFWLASFIRLLGDLAWLYPAYAVAFMITFLTKYESGASLQPLYTVFFLIFIAIIVRELSQFLAKYIGFGLAQQVNNDSVERAMHHAFRLDMSWHEKENTGNKLKRIQNAGDGFTRIVRIWYGNIIEIIVNLIAINFIIFRFDRLVSFLLIIFLVSYFLISRTLTKKATAQSVLVGAQEEEVNGLVFESLNNIRTVKVMSMSKTLFTSLITNLNELYTRTTRRIFWYQFRGSLTSAWAACFRILGFIFITYGILNQKYDIAFLILFQSYFGALTGSIAELSNASIELAIARVSIARMNAILEEPITIDNDRGKSALSKNWKEIRFEDVSFSYENNQVLKNISFTIKRGEKVGIVGLSGAGKSTLFKLLLKEREEFTGNIFFDQTSIKKIRRSDYFDHISVVLQDTEVFNFSLKKNIAITNTKESKNKKLLTQALTTAHIIELVDKLPQGLETPIGEKGVKLSGGERQRVGIARAIFKNPEILLMDEATSHLDLESEEKIRDSLHKFFENVTAIVIAHRLTTIKAMDRILVLEYGEIIESGSFDELYAKRGRFYDLWEKQKL